jgi:hypothetical protein
MRSILNILRKWKRDRQRISIINDVNIEEKIYEIRGEELIIRNLYNYVIEKCEYIHIENYIDEKIYKYIIYIIMNMILNKNKYREERNDVKENLILLLKCMRIINDFIERYELESDRDYVNLIIGVVLFIEKIEEDICLELNVIIGIYDYTLRRSINSLLKRDYMGIKNKKMIKMIEMEIFRMYNYNYYNLYRKINIERYKKYERVIICV